MFNLAPADVDFVSATAPEHPWAIPIEVQALAEVYGKGRTADKPLQLGSVKSNIGHTESAAGVAGLIKAVLALQGETIPQTLHVGVPNEHIPWADLPVSIATEARPWQSNGRPRRVGVSSLVSVEPMHT